MDKQIKIRENLFYTPTFVVIKDRAAKFEDNAVCNWRRHGTGFSIISGVEILYFSMTYSPPRVTPSDP